MRDIELETAVKSRLKESEHYSAFPDTMIRGIVEWIAYGAPQGRFLECLFRNDLRGVFSAADHRNEALVRHYVSLMYNYAPAGCWGSAERASAWANQGGLKGQG
jgi:hypothetical protein